MLKVRKLQFHLQSKGPLHGLFSVYTCTQVAGAGKETG